MKFYAITENHLYAKAFTKGRRWSGRFISVFLLRDYAAERLKRANPLKRRINRIGISVTKKIGGAVVRNRAKRLIRAALQQIVRTETVETGWLIVISAHPAVSAETVKSPQVCAELRTAFCSLGLLRPESREDRPAD